MDLPTWIKIPKYDKGKYLKTLDIINENKLTTVCLEANCPNRYECFACGTATFMILGNVCTRNCRYCNIKKGLPKPIDIEEPKRIAAAVKKMRLDYAVITCVTRDDLADGGADQFVKTIKAIRKSNPDCNIEVLVSDLKGNWKALGKIVDLSPDVLNHNIEVVEALFSHLRPKGSYRRSLKLLRQVKKFNSRMKTKSGLMIGLGETEKQIIKTFRDLKTVGCDILTVGQYLQPSSQHAPVKKFYKPKEFKDLKEIGISFGFSQVEAGPLVRSSYGAEKVLVNSDLL